jgi:sulfoacetaldehyde acetyltransferase
MKTVAKADVLLALGCRLGPFGTLPQYDMDYWPSGAKIIQVDMDHRQLGLSKKVDLSLSADAGEFAKHVLLKIKQKQKPRNPDSDRLNALKEEKENWQKELDGWASAHSKGMHPRRFLKELAAAVPKGAIITTDVGNTCSMCNSYFRPSGARQFLAPLSWGNCGIAYGVAMGAKTGAPDKPVFALQGDGAYGISGLSEVMTSVREEIPVIAVVFNNDQWGAEKKNQIDYYDNRFVGANLKNPDFALIARDMGAEGYRIERPEDIREVVETAVKIQKPVVIDAIVDGSAEVLAEPFRRDALQLPTRHLPKYSHLRAK